MRFGDSYKIIGYFNSLKLNIFSLISLSFLGKKPTNKKFVRSKFDTTKADLEFTTEQIKDKITRHKNLEIFLNELKNQDELIAEFDPLLWNSLVDYVTVFEEDEVQISFKNGIKI